MKSRFGATVLAGALTVATALVAKWEPPPGDPAKMLVAYYDHLGGVWTICYGHTRGVHEGMTATPEQCEAWRNEDLLDAYYAVERCIHAPLTANQLGALIDGTLNLGPALVCGSTLQRRANAGDIAGACRELTEARNSDGGRRGWSFAGGRFVQGLYNRRVDDQAICWPDFGRVVGGVL